MNVSFGRVVYGLAAIGFGACALVWHDIINLHHLKALADNRGILSTIVAIVEILAGAAIMWPKTARLGALAFGAVCLVFTLLTVPQIVAHPLVYNSWGNFFEQFSLLTAAIVIHACFSATGSARNARLAQFGVSAFGLCLISFALEQLFYLAPTASLVPKWIPPGQTFWAIATTAAFALAGIALLTRVMARVASALTTLMLIGFGLLVWLPALTAAPHSFANWSESAETLAIAAAAWVVTDFLGTRRRA